MPGEILNKLGFDCNDAIAALFKMDAAMAAMSGRFGDLGKSMSTWNSGASVTVANLYNIAAAAQSAATAMQKLNDAFSKTPKAPAPPAPLAPPAPPAPPKPPSFDDATKSVNRFTVSLQTLSRVAFTQMLVRGINLIRDAFEMAITSNLEFEKRVSELNSILAEPGTKIQGLGKQMADLSAQFAFPIKEVVEAEYQAVSAQFTEASERSDVMSASMKLARVGCMELNTAVGLVTGALNAYGLSAVEAETVSAKFFQAIRDGKVRGEELAGSLGKILPMAADLKVSLNEVLTAMVQMTVSGVKPAEAATSIRAAMMSMLKPSEDLKKELKNLHGEAYSSAEQLFAAHGFIGGIQLMRDSTDGSVASLVGLMKNVRGLSAAFRDSGEAAEKANAELERMKKASAETLNKSYKVFIETNAFKVQAEIEKLKTYLATDLGESLVESLQKSLAFVGGVDTLKTVITALAPVVIAATAAFAAWGVGTLIVKTNLAATAVEVTGFRKQLNALEAGIGGVVGVGATLYTAFNIFTEGSKNAWANAERDFDRFMEERKSAIMAAKQAEINAANEAAEKTAQTYLTAVAKIREAWGEVVDRLKEKNQDLVNDTARSVSDIVSIYEKRLHTLRELETSSLKSAEDEEKRVAEMRGNLADRIFLRKEKSTRIPDTQKFEDELARSKKLQAEGTRQLAAATTKDEREAAEATLKRADSMAKVAETQAVSMKNAYLEKEAVLQSESIERSRIKAGERFAMTERARSAAAADAVKEELERVDKMREAGKGLVKTVDLFNKKGEPLTGAEAEKAHKQFEKYWTTFEKASLEGKKWDVSTLLNVTDLKKKMQEQMQEVRPQIEQIQVLPTALSRLNTAITKGVGVIKVAIEPFLPKDFDIKKSTMGKAFEEAEKASRQAVLTTKERGDLEQKRTDAEQNLLAIQNKMLARPAELESWGLAAETGAKRKLVGTATIETPEGVRELGKKEYGELEEAISRLTAMMAKVAGTPRLLTPENVASLMGQYTYLGNRTPWPEQSRLDILGKQAVSLQTALETSQSIKGYTGKLEGGESKSREAQYFLRGAGTIQEEQISEAIKKAHTPLEKNRALMQGFGDVDIPEAIKQVDALTESVSTLSETTHSVNIPVQGAAGAGTVPTGGTPLGEAHGCQWAHGGWVHTAHLASQFAAGGSAKRGTDTIQAMLSPGEMVINARSARHFATQLSAMNAGSRPNHYNHGGSVTNVGDINVNLNHHQRIGPGLGREIGTEIRRELRRGNVKL
jgi:TP901 family phage tail tape measure protein